jgi:hypothetical protein
MCKTTHHLACECREQYFAELECENRRLRRFLQTVIDESIQLNQRMMDMLEAEDGLALIKFNASL